MDITYNTIFVKITPARLGTKLYYPDLHDFCPYARILTTIGSQFSTAPAVGVPTHYLQVVSVPDGHDFPGDLNTYYSACTSEILTAGDAAILANNLDPARESIVAGKRVVYGTWGIDATTGALVRSVESEVSYSSIEEIFQQERDILKTQSITYIKTHPTCTQDEVAAEMAQYEQVIRWVTLSQIYITGAKAQGFIQEANWETFKNFILATPVEALMQI